MVVNDIETWEAEQCGAAAATASDYCSGQDAMSVHKDGACTCGASRGT